MQGNPPKRMRGLDGLRSLAVILVLGYHLIPGLIPSGMVGVDVFFVISGFLITSLLVAGARRRGRINLRQFSQRRFRRLVPALAFAVAGAATVAFMVGGDALLAIRRQVFSALTFTSNWVEIAVGSSYFERTQPLLLTNTWSLSVEAQFYLIWPVILAVALGVASWNDSDPVRAVARMRLPLGVLAALAACASAVWAIWALATGADASRVYMGTDTHAFGLMAGSALALLHGYALDARPVDSTHAPVAPAGAAAATRILAIRRWLALLGVATVMVVAFVPQYTASTILRSVLTMLGVTEGLPSTQLDAIGSELLLMGATVGTVLIIQALLPEVIDSGRSTRLLTRILELSPVRWLGERSYGVYLWHWPLHVIAFYALPAVPAVLAGCGVLLASLALAELSYRFVETPARRQGLRKWFNTTMRSRLSFRVLPLRTALASVGICAVGALIAQPSMSSAAAAIEAGRSALTASANAVNTAATAPNAAADSAAQHGSGSLTGHTAAAGSSESGSTLAASGLVGTDSVGRVRGANATLVSRSRTWASDTPTASGSDIDDALVATTAPFVRAAEQVEIARAEAQAAALAQAEAEAEAAAQAELRAAAEAAASKPTVPSSEVSIVGDSVTLASAQGLIEALPEAAIDAEVSRSIFAGLSTLDVLDQTYGKRRYVVLGLATNSALTVEQLGEVFSQLGPDRRLILVTAFAPESTTWVPTSNAAIWDFAGQHSDRVRVADWAGAIAPATDLLAQDLIHPGPEGGRIYAQSVQDALTSFAEADAQQEFAKSLPYRHVHPSNQVKDA